MWLYAIGYSPTYPIGIADQFYWIDRYKRSITRSYQAVRIHALTETKAFWTLNSVLVTSAPLALSV